MDRGFFGTMGAGVLALVCCAGGPAVLAAIGGVSLGGVLGPVAALLASLILLIALTARRRARLGPAFGDRPLTRALVTRLAGALSAGGETA